MSTPLERRAALTERTAQYQRMVEIRTVERHAQQLFTDGHIRGTTHLSDGQEAVSVGVAAAARPTDVVTCTYRGHGMALSLGVTPVGVLGELAGRTIGCLGGVGGSMHLSDSSVGLFPTFAIIGAGIPIAVGAALTASLKGTRDAAIAVFGDGTTNIGAFHEALNLAAIWRLPVVFVIENNLYGEYTRINLSTPVENLADRATSYAIPGRVVDGQDVDAVRDAVAHALDHARAGHGPTLLEMKTYRYTGHSKTDPAAYRPAGELDHWRDRDPIELFGARLRSDGVCTGDELAALRADVELRVDAAVAEVLASPEPGTAEMFRHVGAQAPASSG